MEADWRICSKRADFDTIAKHFNIDPVVARILRNRDLTELDDMERFLYGTLDSCHAPERLMDMDKAAGIIRRKIEDKASIRVVGDYDVDGVTSTYILYDGIRRLGGNISFDIPHRISDGYGINERIIEEAGREGVDTIITCDNGIAAFDALDRAAELGMTVVVTDHHEIQGRLPEASAVVDPHRADDSYPYKNICGALVAYKFIKYLYKNMGVTLPERKYLEFAALATVCDVMPLLDENRIIVREGLRTFAATDNIGLRALLSANGLDDGREISSYHLGFVIGPCINTVGRLGAAVDAVKLFISEDSEWCTARALEIKRQNDERKKITEEGTAAAIETVEAESAWSEDDVIVEYLPGVHESLAGIIAGKLKEHFYRPAIVFTDSSDTDYLKGSGRSIEAYNMFEELTGVKELLHKFGGHKLAAGVTIRRDKLIELKKVLNDRSHMTEADKTPKLMIDVPMPMRYVNMNLIRQLDALGPFGTANERPLFAEAGMQVLSAAVFGRMKNVIKLRLKDSRGGIFEALSFDPEGIISNIKLWFSEADCDKMLKGYSSEVVLDIAYQPGINVYNGVSSIQFMIKNYRPHGRVS